MPDNSLREEMKKKFEERFSNSYAYEEKLKCLDWFLSKLDAAVKEVETKAIEKCIAELERETGTNLTPDEMDGYELAIQALKELLPQQNET